MEIEHLLVRSIPILAHIGRRQDETLLEHSNLVMEFCDRLKRENGLYDAVRRTIIALTFNGEPLLEEEQILIEKWFYRAIFLHDIGKVNIAFQKLIMKNKFVTIDKETMTHHSLLSSLVYLQIHEDDLPSEEEEEKIMFFSFILYIFSYIISRHHSYLEDFSIENYNIKLNQLFKKMKRKPKYLDLYMYKEKFLKEFDIEEFTSDGYLDSESHNHYPLYILTRLLYSSLVACDFYATYTYDKDGKKPQFRYLDEKDKKTLRKTFNNFNVIEGIEKYKRNSDYFHNTPINKLRSDIFIEAENQLRKNIDKQIFYLEAPTGSGKTITSINLGLTLLENDKNLNKIIYIFPFNTLVEQTKKVFDDVFPEEIQKNYPITVINSVTPIIQKREMEEIEDQSIDYKEEVLYRQMLQYPITITSHVNFFHYLFGTGRESNLAFVHLCNSVIIIDEIQSYKNARWMEIIEFLSQYAELLNMKIVIMSATLPKLDRLINIKNSVVELLPNAKKYFSNPLFKNRVLLHYELLDEGKITHERLVEKVLEKRKEFGHRRILIECIRKKDAEIIYELLINIFKDTEVPIALLTGSNHSYYRNKVLEKLGKNEDGSFKLVDVILVATQVIEAGVDIDMDIGFKDISTLDSEEQFLGRINRSCLRKDCHAYFFHMSDAERIYRNDYRLQYDLRDDKYREYLIEKDFSTFYENVFTELLQTKNQLNEHNIIHFHKKIHQLQYCEVARHLELIEDKKYRLFIVHQIELDNGEILDGNEVWQQFIELIFDKEMDYSQRRVELSRIVEKMSYFIYTTYEYPRFYENIGDLFFVDNGEQFLEKDSFTGLNIFREDLFINQGEEMIL